MNRTRLVVSVLLALAVSALGWSALNRSNLVAQETKPKCILFAPQGYPDHTNCPECIKDKAQLAVAAGGVITKDFSKNDYYVQPPTVLGDGHMLKIDLDAPGKIISITRGCYGLGCGWTHDVTYQNIGTKTATWIGWSNSGQNCVLSFTITYQ